MINQLLTWTGYWRSGSVMLALGCLVAGQQGQVLPQAKDPLEASSGQKGAGSKNAVPAQTPSPAGEKRDLHIYEPKWAKANELASLLSNLYRARRGDAPLLQVTVDEKTNRLFLSADAANWGEITALLAKIDVQTSAGGDGRSLEFIPLGRGLSGDYESLQNVLNMLFANNPTVKYSLVPSKNLLILNADEKARAEVQKLCIALAESREPARAPESVARTLPTMQIRLLWLVDSQAQKDGSALTGDVLKIVPVLAKLGVEHPRLLSNSLVTCIANVEPGFTTTGNAFFGGEAQAFVHFKGHCGIVDSNHVALSVDLRINSEEDDTGKSVTGLAGITTEIQTPLGHYVVLGMTPSQGKTSVFVIQVTKVE